MVIPPNMTEMESYGVFYLRIVCSSILVNIIYCFSSKEVVISKKGNRQCISCFLPLFEGDYHQIK